MKKGPGRGLTAVGGIMLTQNTRPTPANENLIIKHISFTHPYLNSENIKLQKDLNIIQGKKRTWFCGSYFGYGFHEDGLKSTINMIKNFKNI